MAATIAMLRASQSMARNYAAFVRPAAAVDAGQNRAGSRGHHVRMQRPSLIPKAELRRAGKVAVALHERLKVEIPEADYAKLGTLDEIVAYLAQKKPA